VLPTALACAALIAGAAWSLRIGGTLATDVAGGPAEAWGTPASAMPVTSAGVASLTAVEAALAPAAPAGTIAVTLQGAHRAAAAGTDAASQIMAGPALAVFQPAPADATGTPLASSVVAAFARLPASAGAFAKLEQYADGRLFERVPGDDGDGGAPLEIAYTFDRELSDRVHTMLRRYRVEFGHVVVADARTGRLLVYASTNTATFPPTKRYPAASLVKVVTAAAALRHAPEALGRDCRFQGNPYRLTRARLKPPKRGTTASFRRAIATSNNQCFAHLAVHALGYEPLLAQLEAFGWRGRPGPGHDAGHVVDAGDDYALGLLGSGLAGAEITPLHGAQLGLVLASGKRREPYWIEAVYDVDQTRILPHRAAEGTVLTDDEAARLRDLLVETTRSGTARRAFRHRGRPLLSPVTVAGKTGSLSGKDPVGRYEWFVGVAPAEEPEIAVAVLTMHRGRWLRSSSQLAAEVLRQTFCPKGVCSAKAGHRWLEPSAAAVP
jgi:hypothetical protein